MPSSFVPTDLLLLDRGYPSFLLFKMIIHSGANCCARVKLNQWAAVKDFYESNRLDAEVSIHPSAEAKKTMSGTRIGHSAHSSKTYQDRFAGRRSLKYWPRSLTDADFFKYEQFQELYHHRWPVEEDYKVMKHRIEVESWSGETVESVLQDFHAKVLVKNLTAVLAHCTKEAIEQKTKHRKYEYQINFTQALAENQRCSGVVDLA